jgi:hypothetical protein
MKPCEEVFSHSYTLRQALLLNSCHPATRKTSKLGPWALFAKVAWNSLQRGTILDATSTMDENDATKDQSHTRTFAYYCEEQDLAAMRLGLTSTDPYFRCEQLLS